MVAESSQNDSPPRRQTVARLFRSIAMVAGFVAALSCVLVILNYVQLKTHEFHDNEAIAELLKRVDENPDDQALKEQVRSIDLLARKAFFTKQWQLVTGGYILFGSLLITITALKLEQVLVGGRKRPAGGGSADVTENAWRDAVSGRNGLIAFGIVLCVAAIVVAYISQNTLTSIPEVQVAEAPETTGETEEAGSGEEGDTEQPEQESEMTTAERWQARRQNWPAFRGPTGSGVVRGEREPPVQWDGNSGESVLWKKEVPLPGRNSPVIWKDRLFLAGATEETEKVFCFDVDSGDLRWEASLSGIRGAPDEPPDVTEDTGYAPSTVATDGEYVYAIFPTGNIAGFDFEGNQLWGKNLGVPENPYGHGSSLIAFDGKVFVQYDQNDRASVRALGGEQGQVIWKKERDLNICWASPILVQHDDRTQLVLNGNPAVMAYNAQTGEQLWRTECMSGEVAPSPTYADGKVFVVNQYASAVALDAGSGEQLWSNSKPQLPNAASPVASDEHLFFPTNYGMFSCLNTDNGEVAWTHSFDQGSFSSPVLVGDRIYWTTFEGKTHILKATGEYEQTSTSQLGEETVTTPAFVDDRMYIRGSEHLYCIGEQ